MHLSWWGCTCFQHPKFCMGQTDPCGFVGLAWALGKWLQFNSFLKFCLLGHLAFEAFWHMCLQIIVHVWPKIAFHNSFFAFLDSIMTHLKSSCAEVINSCLYTYDTYSTNLPFFLIHCMLFLMTASFANSSFLVPDWHWKCLCQSLFLCWHKCAA